MKYKEKKKKQTHEAAGGDDECVGLLEHLVLEELLHVVQDEIETKSVLLDTPKAVDRGLGDLAGLHHGAGKSLCCDDSEPVAVLHIAVSEYSRINRINTTV